MTERETKTDKTNSIVRNYMLGALAVGLIPLPFVDLVALSGIQLKMLHSLARLYDVEFSEQLGKSMIASLLGGGIPISFSSNLASLVKSIPFYGLVTGMISVSLFGGASTYAIGQVFIQHFESGGTFLNFDPQQVRDYYAKQFKEGKEQVKKSFAGIKP
jgi:uncharacterized protein (DUF697 family)